MRPRYYRLTVIGCALSWLFVGLHLPMLHQMTHPGHALRWDVVVATTLVAVAALAGVWVLLRVPGRGIGPARSGGADDPR